MLFLVAALAGLSLCHPTQSSIPLPPSQDPWYTAPAGFESAKPGAVLRVRPAPGNLTDIYSNSSSAYNILYRTTDSRYNPAWAVTTLFEPNVANSSALVSYQIPYDTDFLDASPSYSLYQPFSPLGDNAYVDIQNMLGAGWAVVTADYEGPRAAFGNGIQAGHATLDSIRAVLNSGHGCRKDGPYALWGYSGGSIASEWATELQAQYAPELNISGAALGGLVPKVEVVSQLSGTIWAGLFPLMVVGITSEYPEAYDYIVSQLKSSGPNNATTFLSIRNLTLIEAQVVFNGTNVFDFLVNGSAILDAPVFRSLLDNLGTMGFHGIPQMPLFVYKAIADEVAPVNDTDALVERYCGVGVNIVYERNSIAGHLAEAANEDANAFEFLQSVLAGTYQHSGCTVRNVTLNVTDSPL